MLRDQALPRIFVDLPVEISASELSEPLKTRSYDLSANGMYLCSQELLEENTQVEVACELPTGQPFRAKAVVLRIAAGSEAEAPHGMAVRFQSFSGNAEEQLKELIAAHLEPAKGAKVHMRLAKLDVPLTATVKDCFDDVVSIEAPLPFLEVGGAIELQSELGDATAAGRIRWVSVQTCPNTGVPRLNIGVGTEGTSTESAEIARVSSAAPVDDQSDPVCTPDFAKHAEQEGAKRKRRRRRRKRG